MARLEDFLKAGDLDDLLRFRQQLAPFGAGEIDRIAELIRAWLDGQAISNLSSIQP
jgi:hypothetical protein